MHIVQAIENLIPAGTSTILINLSRMLRHDGHRVTVLIGRSGDYNNAALLNGLHAAGCDLIELGWAKNPYNALRFWSDYALRAARVLRQLGPDLVHTHSFYAEQALQLGRFKGKPIIATLHTDSPSFGSPAPQHRLRDALARSFYLRDDVSVVCVSRCLAERVRTVFSLVNTEITVIHNALAAEWFESIDHDAARDIDILQVGRMDHNKDQTFTVSVLAELARRGCSFRAVFLGEGPLLPAVRRAVADAGLQGFVELPGNASNPRPFYRRARIAVATSHYEAFSLVPIEAIASGAVCVATDIPAHREVLNGGVAGTLLPPGDVDVWATTLEWYLANRRGEPPTARSWAQQEFAIDRFYRGYADVYRRALKA